MKEKLKEWAPFLGSLIIIIACLVDINARLNRKDAMLKQCFELTKTGTSALEECAKRLGECTQLVEDTTKTLRGAL